MPVARAQLERGSDFRSVRPTSQPSTGSQWLAPSPKWPAFRPELRARRHPGTKANRWIQKFISTSGTLSHAGGEWNSSQRIGATAEAKSTGRVTQDRS
jgi:hypothetical protein